MKKCILISVIAILLSGCNRYYFARDYETNFSAKEYVTIDSSYVWYVREVYKDTIGNAEGKKIQKSGVSAINPYDDKLIETEYLLVSRSKNNVIYLATIPDKRQRYYSKSRKKFGDSAINIYDIRKIFFGKATGDEFEFKYKKRDNTDIWIMRYYTGLNLILLDRLRSEVDGQFDQMIPVSDALANDILFRKIDHPKLIFNRADKNYDCQVYNRFTVAEEKGKHEVIFHLANPAGSNSFIIFSEDKIPYSPKDFTFDRHDRAATPE